jgi:hypothetical protein
MIRKQGLRLLLHYLHGLFWAGILLAALYWIVQRNWSFQLTPLMEIGLLALLLALPFPLAIMAQRREAAAKGDPHAVEHLFGSAVGQVLSLLFDLGIVAIVVTAYFGFVFALWHVLRLVVG